MTNLPSFLCQTSNLSAPHRGFSDITSYRNPPVTNKAISDNGLRIRRTLLDRNGQPVTELRHNNLFTIKLASAPVIDNVVITDLLPAGL